MGNRLGRNCVDNVVPPFIVMKDVCLPDGHAVPGLNDGYMTIEAAKFACFWNVDANVTNCKGFWYYPPVEKQLSLTSSDVKCGEDFPWYGEKLIYDSKCADPTCTGDCQLGCIGADSPTCSRCIYNMVSCRSTLGEELCENLTRGAELRGSASCTTPAPRSNEVYVRFSTMWDPIYSSTGKCDPPPGQLSVSIGAYSRDPEAQFNPANVEKNTKFVGEPAPLDIDGKTKFASSKDAFSTCYQHHLEHPENPCMGFNYSHPNKWILNKGPMADVTFMSGMLNPMGRNEQATLIATWKAPEPTEAKESLVV